MTQTKKNREARVRRLAKSAGYALHKSRASESIDNLGGFMIVGVGLNGCVAGSRFNFDMDDVEAWLADIE